MDDKNEVCIMYILINENLKMSPGFMAEQVANSACLVQREIEKSYNKPLYYNKWLDNYEKKVTVTASEDDLLYCVEKYVENSDIWCKITKSFAYEDEPLVLTSLAFRPMVESEVPNLIKKLEKIV